MTTVEFWRQLPRNARITLIALGTVTLLILIGSLSTSREKPLTAAAPGAATTTTTTTTRTTTTTPPPPLTVRAVVDGRTVTLSNGTEVVVQGLAQPGECWANAALDFARTTLLGQPIKITWGSTKVATVALPDGTDFAVLAASKGEARADSLASAAIQAAEAAAKKASLGFWGPSCGGLDVKDTQPNQAPSQSVFFNNCDEAKAAGAAPMRAGEPGYRLALDRDEDGVACE